MIAKRNATYDCESSSAARDSCTLFAKSKAKSKKPRSQRITIKQMFEKRKALQTVPITVTVKGPDNAEVQHTMNVIRHVSGGDVLRVEYTAENIAVVVQVLREYGFDERRRQLKNVMDLPDDVGAGIHRRKNNKFIVKKRTRSGKTKYTTCVSLDAAIQQQREPASPSASEASTCEGDVHAELSGGNDTTPSTQDTPPADDQGTFEICLS